MMQKSREEFIAPQTFSIISHFLTKHLDFSETPFVNLSVQFSTAAILQKKESDAAIWVRLSASLNMLQSNTSSCSCEV